MTDLGPSASAPEPDDRPASESPRPRQPDRPRGPFGDDSRETGTPRRPDVPGRGAGKGGSGTGGGDDTGNDSDDHDDNDDAGSGSLGGADGDVGSGAGSGVGRADRSTGPVGDGSSDAADAEDSGHGRWRGWRRPSGEGRGSDSRDPGANGTAGSARRSGLFGTPGTPGAPGASGRAGTPSASGASDTSDTSDTPTTSGRPGTSGFWSPPGSPRASGGSDDKRGTESHSAAAQFGDDDDPGDSDPRHPGLGGGAEGPSDVPPFGDRSDRSDRDRGAPGRPYPGFGRAGSRSPVPPFGDRGDRGASGDPGDPSFPGAPINPGDPGVPRPGFSARVPLPGPRSAADDAARLPLLDGSGPPPPPDGPGPINPHPSPPGDLSWDESDWNDALLRARRAGRAYVYLNLVEQRLRSVVRQVLRPVYESAEYTGRDDGGWVAAAAGPTQSDWVERAEAVREMSRRRGYIVDPADDDLVAFLTLPQLRELVVRNWWCFAPYLSDRHALERALEEVEIGRHIVARNRVLSPDVLRQVEQACTRVLAELDGRLGRHAGERLALDAVEELFAGRYGDVVGVFPDRSSLQRKLPFADLIGEARTIDAMGVSLNLICQNYSGRELHRRAASRCRMRLAFLNPAGDAMRQREKDEGLKRGILSRLTTMNILHARRVRARLADPERIEIRVYDETPRFNAYLVDGDTAVVQPYLRRSRGVESPSFVLRAGSDAADPRRGLYAVFQEEFEQVWAAGKRTA